ncbi:MAG: acyloxyacyl hydrolase, partial [Candidatus Acidiferrales bacterium]
VARSQMMRFPLLAFAALMFSAPAHSQSQTPTQPPSPTQAQPAPLYPPGNEFGVWGGYSVANSQIFGSTSDRQLGVFALRYARTLYDKPSTALQYTLDIVPLETLRQPTYQVCTPPTGPSGYCATGRETVYGGGVSPIGLKLNFRRVHRLQPFIASTAGFVASLRPVPVDIPGGTQFNFTFDFQTGVDWFNSARDRAWRFGYKYQHISNAYRHSFNPGVDVHVFYIGYSFFK